VLGTLAESAGREQIAGVGLVEGTPASEYRHRALEKKAKINTMPRPMGPPGRGIIDPCERAGAAQRLEVIRQVRPKN